jgi:carotenoid cleavage dioxygenase-like enzyme
MYRFDVNETPTFKSRWLESDFLRQVDSGRRPDATFDTPRNPSFWHWLLHPIPPQYDNCNVNVLALGESTLVLTETYKTLEIDPESLAVKRPYPWSGELPKKMMQLAHPRFHRQRGEVITLCSKLGPTSKIHVTAVTPLGERRTLNTWKTRHWPYLHDFGLTETHAIIVAHPYTVDARWMLWSKRGFLPYIEVSDRPTQLVVIPLDGGDPRFFEIDLGFVFHVFNTHQRGSEIVMDVIHHEGRDVMTNLSTKNVLHGNPRLGGEPVRLVLNLANGSVRREALSDERVEFPRINYGRVHQRPYRYGYAVRARCVGEGDERRYESRLAKLDMEGGEMLFFEEPDWIPGEGVFVPRENGTAEDDGYILSVASHRHEERGQLWILDAKDMSLCAKLTVDVALPLGFHGQFYRREP